MITDYIVPDIISSKTWKSGELVEFIQEHPDEKYEEWWEAKNEEGEVGYVPSTYVIVKRDIVRLVYYSAFTV